MTQTRHRTESKPLQASQSQEDQETLESQKAAATAAALERMWGSREEEEEPETFLPEPVKNRIKKYEGRASDVSAQMIDWLDRQLDHAWSPAFEKVWEKSGKRFHTLLQKGAGLCQSWGAQAVRHKKILFRCFIGGGAAAAAILFAVSHMSAYEYMYNGKVLGVVKDPRDVYQTVDVIGDKLCTAYNTKIKMNKDQDITFRRVMGSQYELDDKDAILDNLTYLKDMKVTGCGIYVDGRQTAVVDSEKGAKQILTELTQSYVEQNANKQYEEIGFDQKVEIKPVNTRLGELQQKDDVLNFMKTGAEEKQVHSVVKGETFSQIAQSSGLKLSELIAANPGIDPNRIQIGQELTLTKVSPIVDVQTVEIASYKMPVYYGIDYENSGAVYKGEQAVKQQGQNGRRQVTAKILRKNGVEESRTELSSQVVRQPVNQVILVGTKDKPICLASGKLMYPVRGKLSSRYGSRWGRMHSGIDLAVPKGTAIAAADGGTVTFAGKNGELGNCVKIDHGNGTETWYGHASKLLVKTGQKVQKGQSIAKAGSTGNSTGSHVHFEVHVNGKAVNPLNYL